MAVQMQSSSHSELSPRVTVFDASLGNPVQALAANSYGATVTATYTVQPNQVYYIRATAANGGPSDTGTFGLQINIGSTPSAPYSPPSTTVAAARPGGRPGLPLGRLRRAAGAGAIAATTAGAEETPMRPRSGSAT